jgi:hypothetical protein
MRKKIFSILTLCLFVSAGVAWADNFWVGTVSGGGESVDNVRTFDWASSGSGVAEGMGPAGSDLFIGDEFMFRYQAFLVNLEGPEGEVLGFPGLNQEVEFTIVAEIPEVVSDLFIGDNDIATALFTTLPGGKFFIYFDASRNVNVPGGFGFDDGVLIASGTINADQTTSFTYIPAREEGIGATVLFGMVDYVNPDFIDPADHIVGIRFESTINYPPGNSATSSFFEGRMGEGNLDPYAVQDDDLVLKVDASSAFLIEEIEGIPCRVTGGGHSTSGLDSDGESWDGTLAEVKTTGSPAWYNTYQFGGQAGANTAMQPEPKGEWTHHQQRGPDGSFMFHAGTASAPVGTEITMIECSDPGNCLPARPAPAKQIDFNGVGTFKNIRDAAPSLADVVPGETFHYFEVHIEDLGEPGNNGKQPVPDQILCPPEGSPGEVANCGCPDFYRITIYAGVYPEFDPVTGKITNLNKTDVIYDVYGYLTGGNLQIHPPTGFDMQ